MTRRSTSTVMVLSILSLVTRPVSTRFGISRLSLLRHGGAMFLRQNCFRPCDIAPYFTHASGAFLLAGRTLEAQVELLFTQIEQQGANLVVGFGADIDRLVAWRRSHLR